MNAKPIASLSIDLDDKWAYLRAAGHSNWETSRGYLPFAIDRVVEMLGELGLPLTVFTVGRDYRCDRNCLAIRSFGRLGRWEVANHSLNHLPWMHTLSAKEIEDEVRVTHERIRDVLGTEAIGFRGPGFSCPPEVLRVLASMDYRYDASIFPTSIAPIARAVFLIRSNLTGAERERAKKLYGGFRSLLHPNHPYRRPVAIEDRESELWEIPVTVMPWIRTPIHFSYFTFLASKSVWVAKAYFRGAIALCRLTGTTPSLLLHPPDFLGCEDDAEMAYFPAMDMSRARKEAVVRWALRLYQRTFDVKTMADQVQLLDRTGGKLNKNVGGDAAARPRVEQ